MNQQCVGVSTIYNITRYPLDLYKERTSTCLVYVYSSASKGLICANLCWEKYSLTH